MHLFYKLYSIKSHVKIVNNTLYDAIESFFVKLFHKEKTFCFTRDSLYYIQKTFL